MFPSHSFSFFNPRPRVGATEISCSEGVYRFFQSTPRRATNGDYVVIIRTAAVNPTAKACFCQSSHSCNRASSVSKLTDGAIASICLCSDSDSNNAGSRLHSPSYRASNSGFIVPPLTFAVLSAIIDFAAFRRCDGL